MRHTTSPAWQDPTTSRSTATPTGSSRCGTPASSSPAGRSCWCVDVPATSQVTALDRDDVVRGQVVAGALVAGGRLAHTAPVVAADQDGVAGSAGVRRPGEHAGPGRGGDHAPYDLGCD